MKSSPTKIKSYTGASFNNHNQQHSRLLLFGNPTKSRIIKETFFFFTFLCLNFDIMKECCNRFVLLHERVARNNNHIFINTNMCERTLTKKDSIFH